MATGVPPRDEDLQITRTDLENIQDAMKQKKFRDLFSDYCKEVRDPANQARYQKEMTQLEKERGYDVTFINPQGGYVIKTSVAGDKKAFINICSNDNVGKPSCKVEESNGQRGMNWQIPYSLIPPREDYNSKREKVILYDVVFHPDTLRMAELNKRFRELVNKTAMNALADTYKIHLDSNNCRFPKSQYKGMAIPAVIRTEDPNYQPPTDEEVDEMKNLSPEMMEKLYPQRLYPETATNTENQPSNNTNSTKTTQPSAHPKPSPQISIPKVSKPEPTQQRRKVRRGPEEFTHLTDNGYTKPKYVIKQQKNVDFQDYTYHKDCKQYTAIPSQIVVEINLPLLSSTKDCILDVEEKSLSLKSEKPAKYKLNISLPYSVNDECGSAKFDKTKHKLIVTLPVIRKNISYKNTNSLKVDSGVESEENSGSQSEEENIKEKEKLIVELCSKPAQLVVPESPIQNSKEDEFFNPTLGYTLPSFTHNVLDDIIAFTFHVKNTEPDSVKVKKEGDNILIKFTSIGSGFVPVHYGALIKFDDCINFNNVTGEAWDNNVILQMELAGEVPQKFQIGLSDDDMSTEYFDDSQLKKVSKLELEQSSKPLEEDTPSPVVEVTNLGSETNIVVSSTASEYDEDDDIESPTSKDDVLWTDPSPNEYGAKSILRKPASMMRSFSESSVGDVASSMDYMSSDCIPEGSSFKKTVRFNDVIARQFYRYNSSIEGQKKKNQRKKSKKRSQDRRKSESEAEDEILHLSKVTKPKLKSVLKQRRDSGLADTSDAEADCRSTPLDFKWVDLPKDDVVFDNDQQSKKSEIPSENDEATERSVLNIVNKYFEDNDHLESEKPPIEPKVPSENNKDTEKSVLNIVDKIQNVKDDVVPVIWETETAEPKPSKETENVEKSEPVTCETIKHNTEFYNPDKLNKGQYLEVTFKNDLIFDLDM